MASLDQPHDDPCPGCGETAWETGDDDTQQCGACGTRICPVCGADFAEEYSDPEQDRLTDCLGDHMRQWHGSATLRWKAVWAFIVDVTTFYVAGTVRPGCRAHRAAAARMVYCTGQAQAVTAEQAFALLYQASTPRTRRLLLAARDAGREGGG